MSLKQAKAQKQIEAKRIQDKGHPWGQGDWEGHEEASRVGGVLFQNLGAGYTDVFVLFVKKM